MLKYIRYTVWTVLGLAALTFLAAFVVLAGMDVYNMSRCRFVIHAGSKLYFVDGYRKDAAGCLHFNETGKPLTQTVCGQYTISADRP